MLSHRTRYLRACRARGRNCRTSRWRVFRSSRRRRKLFASGCRLLVSLTSAGQITPSGPPPYFVIIDRALRDEGTSYHYLPPSEFAEADSKLVVAAANVTLKDGPRVVVGSTWTTDALPGDRRGYRSCTKQRNSCSWDGSSSTLRVCTFSRRTPSMSCAYHQHHGSGRRRFRKGRSRWHKGRA
jgi:hypothetical protein